MKYVIILSAFLFTSLLSAQSVIDTTITLSDHTGNQEMVINVPDGAENLAVAIEGKVDGGSFEIELFDPKGQRQGGFQLNSSSDDYVVVRSGSHDDRNAKAKSKSKTKTKSKSKSSNSNSNSNSENDEDEETLISIRSGGKSTSISSGQGSMSVASGNGSVSISSNDGVSKVVTKGLGNGEGSAKGVMVESISKPDAGRWKLRIKSENVTGEIKLEVDHD